MSSKVLGVLVLILTATFSSQTLAETNAVTVTGGTSILGFTTGGFGFSFTPATSITLTSVGYFDATANAAPIVSIWSSTNTILTNCPFSAGTGSQTMRFTNISLPLLAGQSYAITVQDGALNATNTNTITAQVFLPETGATVSVAPEFDNYVMQTVAPSGVFSPATSTGFFNGANFTYVVTGAPVLRIRQIAFFWYTVFWNSQSTGYSLEENFDLSTSSWFLYPGTIYDDGNIRGIDIFLPTGNAFFRLIK